MRSSSHSAAAGASAIRLSDVTFGYTAAPVLRELSLRVAPAAMTGLLGPNGAGKTTVLRLITGALRPNAGAVLVYDVPVTDYSRRALARHVALVPQELQLTFDFTVEELVLMGRSPHVNWLRGDTAADRGIARRALADVGVEALARRGFRNLSGGEKQRVILAMALAQESSILLLDEPTHNLDIANQAALFDLVRRLCIEGGRTIFTVMHDVNLASLYCDQLFLLRDGRIVAHGPPESVISEATMAEVYGASVRVFAHPATGRPQVAILPQGPASFPVAVAAETGEPYSSERPL